MTRFRSISPDFYQKELRLLKMFDPDGKFKVLQNMPIDTPEMIPFVLRHSDAIGLNVYNQHNNLWLPDSFYTKFYWGLMGAAFIAAAGSGKEVKVTEFQIGAWLNQYKKPTTSFGLAGVADGLSRIKTLAPGADVDFWGTDQAIWGKNNQILNFIRSLTS